MAYDEETDEAGETPDQEVAEEALKNYKLACDTYAEQQVREREDLMFQVPELQWDESARGARGGSVSAGVPVPARPCLSISKIEQPIRLVLNQMQSAKLGVNIHPLNEEANDETAEVLQGLYRTIERDSRAELARGWAFDRAVRAGRGYYRVNTVYDESTESPFDQKIVIQRILYQENVKFDPSAIEPDYSDANWAFLTAWMPLETFRRKYPKAEVSGMDDMGCLDVAQSIPAWAKMDGEKKSVLVAEYFCKHYSTVTVGSGKNTREKEEVTLMWYTLAPGSSGLEVLASQEWFGPDIPIIPAIGHELQPFDEERRWFGMVRPARDAQKTYNYAASSLVEMVALEPKAPFVGVEGQFKGHEAKWGQANTRNYPYLEYVPVSIAGSPAPAPARMQVDVSRLGPSMQLLQQSDDFIQSSTSTPDPALGNLNSRDRSGKAITALQGQAEASKSNFLSNFAEVSMQYEAKVVIGMMPVIYDRPGRIAHILDTEDELRPVMLNKLFRMDLKSGRPVAANPAMPPMTTSGAFPMPPQMGMGGPEMGMPPQMGMGGPQMPQGPPPPEPKIYDLSKGRYGVSVTIGKSWQTRLEQGKDVIGQMMEASPDIAPIIMPLWLKFQDFPGAPEMGELMKKVRDKQYPGLDAKEGEEPNAEQLKGMLEAGKGQMEEMKQQLAEAAEMIKTEQTKNQAMLQKAEMDNQTRIQVAEIQAATKLQTEKLNSIMSLVLDRSKSQQDAFNRRHEAELGNDEMAHELGMAMVGHGHAQDMSERGHDQSQDMAAIEAENAAENKVEGGVEE